MIFVYFVLFVVLQTYRYSPLLQVLLERAQRRFPRSERSTRRARRRRGRP